jgi:hypothetical protein
MAFDPSKFGAVEIKEDVFDPAKFGAVPFGNEKQSLSDSLWSKIGQSIQERGKNAGEAIYKTQTGQQSMGSGILQTLGQGAGAVGDVAFQGLKSAAETVAPETTKAIGDVFNKGVNAVASTKTSQAIMDKYAEFKQAHPEAAANLEASGLITSILPMGKVASKGAELASKAIGKTAKVTGNVIGGVTKGAVKQTVKQATAFDLPTIERIVSNPEKFSEQSMANIKPEIIAKETKDVLQKRMDELSTTGKEYNTIRTSKEPVQILPIKVNETLSKYGLSLGKDGKIVTTAESVPLSEGDKSALEKFMSQYSPDKIKTSNAFLNARKGLDNLSSWDATKTDMSDKIARDLRNTYDEVGKVQIGGLSELDAKYSPEIKTLKEYKKMLLNPDGSLKDGAISTIVNSTGVNKAPILEKLEKLSPGITEKIKDLKAVQDISRVQEYHKVGAYAKGAGIGFLASGGNVLGAIAGAILTEPKNVIGLLRAFGTAKNYSGDVINTAIDAIKTGKKLTGDKLNLVHEFVNDHVQKFNDIPGKQGGYIKNPFYKGIGEQIISTPSASQVEDIKAFLSQFDKEIPYAGEKMTDYRTRFEKILKLDNIKTADLTNAELKELGEKILDDYRSRVIQPKIEKDMADEALLNV